MSTMEIIDLVVAIICVLGYAAMMYFKVRGDIVGAVSELIAAAEATGLAGSEKMAQVVARLAEMVPVPFKAFLTADTLQRIAQGVFDWMKQYALNYIEAKKEKTEEEQRKKLYEENADTTASLIVDLISLSREALLEKAKTCDITVTGDEEKDELIRKIVIAILEKV